MRVQVAPLWSPSDPFSPPTPDDRHRCALGHMDPQRQSPPHCSSQPCSPMSPCCEALGYVGIDAVLDQLKIKAMKMGFEFHIMVVGECGAGASGQNPSPLSHSLPIWEVGHMVASHRDVAVENLATLSC